MKYIKVIITITALFVAANLYSQKIDTSHLKIEIGNTGFIYSPYITWKENKKQDSVLSIYIERDTMTAIRNLLTYCLQEKRENDNARILLLMLNLDYLNKLLKNRQFTYYLAEYRKAVAENEKKRKRIYNKYLEK